MRVVLFKAGRSPRLLKRKKTLNSERKVRSRLERGREANSRLIFFNIRVFIDSGMASDGVSHEQCFHHAIMNDDRIDTEANGVSDESENSKTLKEFKSGEKFGEGIEELASIGSLLREEAEDNAVEFQNLGDEASLKACEEVDVLTFGDLYKTSNGRVMKDLEYESDLALESKEFDAMEVAHQVVSAVENEVVDSKEQPCNSSSPEVVPRDSLRSESRENNKQDQDTLEELNAVGSVTRMKISSAAFSPTNNNCKSLELAAESAKPAFILESIGKTENGKVGLDLNSEDVDCELSLKPVNRSAPTEHSGSNGATKLPAIPLHFETIQLGLNCVKEEKEEEDPPLLHLTSSTQPSMRNIDLNDDPTVSDSDPAFSILDSRMIIDRRDELSTRAFIMCMEESTPSSSNWDPDLNLNLNLKSNSGMMRIENGIREEGCLLHLFMPESRSLLGEERRTLKRKEPDTAWGPSGFGYNHLRLKL